VRHRHETKEDKPRPRKAAKAKSTYSRILGDSTVNSGVAISAKRDEIVLLVVSETASGLNMMYLKVFPTTTLLAAPTIAVQDFLP
jgi:hypothetical protein